MNFHRESREESYDVVVIGSGIGGLTAAALLARAGKSVLVVERHDRPGGYAHSFVRKGYTFDSGVHLISGCGPRGYEGGQLIHRTLQALGVSDQVEFVSVDPYTRVLFPGLSATIVQGADRYVATLAEMFPREEQGLRDLMHTCVRLAEEVAIADEIMTNPDTEWIRRNLTMLSRYRKATLGEVLDRFLGDKHLKAIVATHWPYLGLPPSKLSFLYWSTMFVGYTVDGAYYCGGTFQRFANTLVYALQQSGGEVLYKIGVRRIVVNGGEVEGVILDNGQRIRTGIVVSNADMEQTVHSLVDADSFPPEFRRSIGNMRQSLSAFVVYIATDLDLNAMDVAQESFFYPGFDHDAHYTQTVDGKISWFSVSIPSMAEPDIAPAGQHIMILTTLLPYDIGRSWREAKGEYLERMLELASRYFPGLREHCLFVEAGSPRTMERYTLNTGGSAYGWDVSPDQVGPSRINNPSPIDGLYFAGHWSSPGGGVYGVTVSGARTAQQVLGIERQDDLWRLLAMAKGNAP